ncbi:MAG: hypothetical protein Q8916_05345 [Bacteroidota bacterium]|nr:hypothetical protein [Bacteroidota bacterium]MDP4235949.1 hypothetical protein [Bacteroidota bacterium]
MKSRNAKDIQVLLTIFFATFFFASDVFSQYVKIGKDSLYVSKDSLIDEFKSALSNPFRSISLVDKKDSIHRSIAHFDGNVFFFRFSNSSIPINDVSYVFEERTFSTVGTFIGIGAGIATWGILDAKLGQQFGINILGCLSFAALEGYIGYLIGDHYPRSGMTFPIELIR